MYAGLLLGKASHQFAGAIGSLLFGNDVKGSDTDHRRTLALNVGDLWAPSLPFSGYTPTMQEGVGTESKRYRPLPSLFIEGKTSKSHRALCEKGPQICCYTIIETLNFLL